MVKGSYKSNPSSPKMYFVIVMAPQNTMLSEVIGKLSKKSCFTLRVVRLWRVPLRNKPEVARMADMVLQDINRMRIQATIDRFELIEKHNDSIVEHGIYLMKNFNVTPNISGWRPTSHAFKLYFNETTIVNENVVDYPAFPMDLHHYKTVEQVLQTPSSNETPDLIDKVYLSESAGSNMLTFHLLDSGNQRIHVTLWGEYTGQAKVSYIFPRNKNAYSEHIPEMEDFRYSFMAVNEASSQFSGSTTNLSNVSGSPGPIISDISKLLVVKEDKNSTDLPDEILRSQRKGYIFKVSGYQGSGGGRVYNISVLYSDSIFINLHKPAHHDSSSEVDSDDDLHIMMPNTKKQILMWYILDSPIELDGEPDYHEPSFTPSSKRQCDKDCDVDDVGPNTQCSTTKKLRSVNIEKL
ncbi:hypothetical protein OROMI_006062 [Orobanche minor]